MGRRQKPLGGSTEAERFALRLRELRAGRNFTIRRLADKAGYAPSTLSKAESGDQLPSWEVTEAFVQACGEDPATWRSSWLVADAARVQDPPAAESTGPAPAAEPVPPVRSPANRLRLYALIGAALVIVGIVGVLIRALIPDEQPASSATSPPTKTGEWRELAEVLPPDPDDPGDGMDPIRAECGSPAVAATVITLDDVSVRLPQGTEFGRLRLRHQPACRASWGQVLGPHGSDRVVHIAVYRSADQVFAPSSFSGQDVSSYGNMLTTTSGCVYAEAYVRTPQGDGPIARTRCA
ncbi:helix-turn-helix transcriptional regulator [Nonomuraea sp. NPDC050643]|uniref:helix-turn-helix domain-containing protein n=1 Tax=Nonomuraea sp. NPDC050643 TaxID=3155660 RepID=UPI003408D41A